MFAEVFGLKLTIIISMVFFMVIIIPCINAIKGLLKFLKTGEDKQLFKLIHCGGFTMITCIIFTLCQYIAVYIHR